MAQWVRLCGIEEAPGVGMVAEAEVQGVQVCVANVDGTLRALDNLCPHRGGPLGQGWLEGSAVICPWHSWAFETESGCASYPEGEKVSVIPLRVEGADVLIEVEVDA